MKKIISNSFLITAYREMFQKEIYERNRIFDHFELFEMEMKKKIENSILKLSNDSSSRILTRCLNKILNRIK